MASSFEYPILQQLFQTILPNKSSLLHIIHTYMNIFQYLHLKDAKCEYTLLVYIYSNTQELN